MLVEIATENTVFKNMFSWLYNKNSYETFEVRNIFLSHLVTDVSSTANKILPHWNATLKYFQVYNIFGCHFLAILYLSLPIFLWIIM